jgi:hypothetical protein
MPNHQAGGRSLVGCQRMLFQYFHSYLTYLETVVFIRNLRTRHALATRNPPNMAYTAITNIIVSVLLSFKELIT